MGFPSPVGGLQHVPSSISLHFSLHFFLSLKRLVKEGAIFLFPLHLKQIRTCQAHRDNHSISSFGLRKKEQGVMEGAEAGGSNVLGIDHVQ